MNSKPYNKCFFKTTHNSYKFYLKEQLDHGVRGLELDIHDDPSFFRFLRRKDNFKIGHLIPSDEVNFGDGNPFLNNNLEKWMDKIYEWSNKHDHGPITIFLEIKGNFIDEDNVPSKKYGLKRLNEQILKSLGKKRDKLYTYQNFLNFNKDKNSLTWPSIDDLKNKFIVVLMSFYAAEDKRVKRSIFKFIFRTKIIREIMERISLPALKTRIKYFSDPEIEKICFPSFNPNDLKHSNKDELIFFPDKAPFITADQSDNSNFQNYRENDRLIRVDFDPSTSPNQNWFTEVNFPASDGFKSEIYNNYRNDWTV